jgi:hypothetical protein
MLRAPADRLPLLAVLPGGTTNTTARNVGYGADPLVALGRLLAAACRALAPSLAGGGKLAVSCRDDDGAVTLAVQVEPAPGSLRYPLAEDALRRRLQRELGALGAALAVAAQSVLAIRWPASARGLSGVLAES